MSKVIKKPVKRVMTGPKTELHHIVTKVHKLRESTSLSSGRKRETDTQSSNSSSVQDSSQTSLSIHFPISKTGTRFSNSLRSGSQKCLFITLKESLRRVLIPCKTYGMLTTHLQHFLGTKKSTYLCPGVQHQHNQASDEL